MTMARWYGRAGRGADRAELLVEEAGERLGVQQRRRLLVEVALVRAAAALGHEQEVVLGLVAGMRVRVELDLRGQVRAGVALLPHRQRRQLGVAQVELLVRVEDAVGEVALVVPLREHVLAALAHDDRRAGVLAHRQDAAGGDVGVLQQVEGDEPVVRARLGVVEDPLELGEVAGPQQVLDVLHGGEGEGPERLGLDGEERAVTERDLPDALGRDEAVGGVVLGQGQHLGVLEVRHAPRLITPSRSATTRRRAGARAGTSSAPAFR